MYVDVIFPACVHLNGIRWWGKDIRVKPSTAKHVNMAREGVEVSYHPK